MIKTPQYYTSYKLNTSSLLFLVYIVLLFTIVLISCNKTDNEHFNTNQINISITTKSPTPTYQIPTESTISEVKIIVLINNGTGYRYSYIASPASPLLSGNNFSKQFDIDLYTNPNPVKLYIITNANTAIANNMPQVGDTETDIKLKLIQAYNITGITTNFPMWGEYEFPSGITSSDNNRQIQLNVLRAVARVDVNAEIVSSIFTMTSIQIFRANNTIQIIPNSHNGLLSVSQPSVPIISSAAIISTPIAVINNNSTAQLYIPESVAPEPIDQLLNATCIIVGGKYNNSGDTTYYRIDFAPNIPNYPLGQILRNHHYTFDIQNITTIGWNTPEDAAKNQSTNITAIIQDWSDIDINTGLGGSDYFQLSARSATLANTEGTEKHIFVATSVSNYTIQWSDAAGTPIGTPSNIIENSFFRVTKSRYTISIHTLTNNMSTNAIDQYVLIVAKRARILLKITQEAI